jgi:hypothetical protein
MKPPMHKHPKNDQNNPTAGDMQLYRLSGTLKVKRRSLSFTFAIKLRLNKHFSFFCPKEFSPKGWRFGFPSDGRLSHPGQHAPSPSRFRRHGQRS